MSEPAARTILLVEDSPADVSLIRHAIADCGGDIQLALVSDGSEALEFLRKEPPFTQVFTPALILLDFSLPKLNGSEVIKEARRMPAHQAIPLVVFSSASKYIAEALCLHLGANTYVQKPISYNAYSQTVTAIVNEWLPPLRTH